MSLYPQPLGSWREHTPESGVGKSLCKERIEGMKPTLDVLDQVVTL